MHLKQNLRLPAVGSMHIASRSKLETATHPTTLQMRDIQGSGRVYSTLIRHRNSMAISFVDPEN